MEPFTSLASANSSSTSARVSRRLARFSATLLATLSGKASACRKKTQHNPAVLRYSDSTHSAPQRVPSLSYLQGCPQIYGLQQPSHRMEMCSLILFWGSYWYHLCPRRNSPHQNARNLCSQIESLTTLNPVFSISQGWKYSTFFEAQQTSTNTISQIDNKHQRTQMRCELVGTPNRKCLPWCGCRLSDSGPGHQRLFIGVLCTTSKMQSMGKIVTLSKFSECNRNDRRTSWEVFGIHSKVSSTCITHINPLCTNKYMHMSQL